MSSDLRNCRGLFFDYILVTTFTGTKLENFWITIFWNGSSNNLQLQQHRKLDLRETLVSLILRLYYITNIANNRIRAYEWTKVNMHLVISYVYRLTWILHGHCGCGNAYDGNSLVLQWFFDSLFYFCMILILLHFRICKTPCLMSQVSLNDCRSFVKKMGLLKWPNVYVKKKKILHGY